MAIEIQIGNEKAQVTDSADSHKWKTVIKKEDYASALNALVELINKNKIGYDQGHVRVKTGDRIVSL